MAGTCDTGGIRPRNLSSRAAGTGGEARQTGPDAPAGAMPPPPTSDPRQEAPGPVPLDLPAGVHQLCSCGRSRHGWFCDSAHLGSGRVSHELRLEAPATVLLCGCGRSRRYPLCDGRHARPRPRLPWWNRRWWRAWA